MRSTLLPYRFLLIVTSLTMLLGCQPWDLPTRKTQRQCTTPGGQFTAGTNQLVATFSITQPTGTIERIDWDFGDTKTQSTTELGLSHTYAARGTYTVKATLTNLCGPTQSTTLTKTVTVSDIVPPTVTVQDPGDITKTTASLRMTVTGNGKGIISEYGVCYSKTNPTPTLADLKAVASGNPAVGAINALLVTNLEPRVTYYVRAYARNEATPAPGDPVYSPDVKTFRVLYDPILTSSGTPAVSKTNATVGFTVSDPGNPAVTQYGIVYSATTSSPEVSNSPTVAVNNPVVGSNVPISLTNLTLDKTYTYRPYFLVNGVPTYGPSATFSTVDLATDLIVDVPFTNQSLLDQSGNNNNAYPVGTPSFTTDRRGNPGSAILLNGTSQWFYFIDNVALRPAALTISFWINARAFTGTMQLYNKSRFDDSSGEQYSSLIKPTTNGLTINTDIKQNSNCLPSVGWQTFPVTSSIPILNVWRHIVFTYEGRTARMYLDGVLLSERADLPNASMDNCAGGDLKFGAQIKTFPQYFNGAMDDVRVYRRAITQAQVEALKAQ